jgi:hypothetical protein
VCYASNRGKDFVAVVNVFPGHTYHMAVMVRLPDKCEWQNGFNREYTGVQMGPRPIKILVLGV